MQELPQRIVRYTVCFLFLWFGTQQLLNPASWVAFLPAWTGYFPIPSEMFIQLNGWLEVVLALMVGLGLYTRVACLFLSIHLMGIALSVGDATGVRDAALSLFTLSLVFTKPDAWTLDKHLHT